ncbi:hypothetical protein CGRA01v4_04373 [Colletotrichum graminicola]|nr:hypothetical protein CGRA01v4_04373 [Colletotrichum graminicola]
MERGGGGGGECRRHSRYSFEEAPQPTLSSNEVDVILVIPGERDTKQNEKKVGRTVRTASTQSSPSLPPSDCLSGCQSTAACPARPSIVDPCQIFASLFFFPCFLLNPASSHFLGTGILQSNHTPGRSSFRLNFQSSPRLSNDTQGITVPMSLGYVVSSF